MKTVDIFFYSTFLKKVMVMRFTWASPSSVTRKAKMIDEDDTCWLVWESVRQDRWTDSVRHLLEQNDSIVLMNEVPI